MIPSSIAKRDGRVVPFNQERISRAVYRCFISSDSDEAYSEERANVLTNQVVNILSTRPNIQNVEQIQDVVESILNANGEFHAARQYILYREEKSNKRKRRPIPEKVKQAFAESDKYFPTALQKFQFYDKYSRFDYELKRRETWVETVNRSISFLKELSENKLDVGVYDRIQNSILTMRAAPSMRLLAMAGPAARRTNICVYNCSYLVVDGIDAFVEALIVSMNGTGVGYSVERKYVEKLDRVKRQTGTAPIKYAIEDTSEGWAEALRLGLTIWFEGGDVAFDYSLLRPAGAPLKTKGGRSSGPDLLRKLLAFVKSKVLARQGSFLRPIDAHDIMCVVGTASISGGVRRTALISLFDPDDAEMIHSKTGNFERDNSQRWNANNSAVWPDILLTQAEVMQYILDMHNSGRGEPGIFSRRAALLNKPERRPTSEFGTNPCGEIVLRPYQFCNLSSVVSRSDDTLDSLRDKVEVATIIGTIQSMATKFPGLRDIWKQNCDEERLLGVDITGQMDCPAVQDADVMRELRLAALATNRAYADKLGINRSTSITCVKPSGNSSQLFDCSSGLHPRWAKYYVRNVRIDTHSPVYRVMKDAGIPMDPENGQTAATATMWVAHFPVKAPEGSITRHDKTAVEQCQHWLMNKENWTEHNPSCTVTYQPDELLDLARWVYDHQDKIGGLTFLPSSDALYDQMPYEEVSQEDYEKLASKFPDIDFSKIYYYEDKDLTTAAQELACSAGICEI